jgi:hypothetical protein
MWKHKKIVAMAIVIATLVFLRPTSEVVIAQAKASVPRPQDTLALGQDAVKDLLLLMGRTETARSRSKHG